MMKVFAPPPPDDNGSTDDSDIRTVRSNATHLFSATSYYTNPTLPPPSVLEERLESDEISSLGGPGDYASPTSIMTNYESYSKLGAAPMYHTTTRPQSHTKSTTHASNPIPNHSKNELKTISEESEPPVVYHPPSFYKRHSGGSKRHGENISNIAISASQSIADSSSKKSVDGSIVTEQTTTTTSSSRSAASHDPTKTIADGKTSSNTFSRMFQRITSSSSKSPSRNASPVPEVTEPSIVKRHSPVPHSVRHAAKSPRPSNGSPPSSIVTNSPTHGRDSPPATKMALPKSFHVPTTHSSRPSTPTEVMRPSESQASTPKAGVSSSPPPEAPYINPTLKSVSSKLFVPDSPKEEPPTLKLAAVEGTTEPKFRLWTDEDSAIGATWYEFQQGHSFFASPATASPPPTVPPSRGAVPDTPSTLSAVSVVAATKPNRVISPDTPSMLTAVSQAAAPKPNLVVPPDTPSTLTAPEAAPVGPKLSLSRLQLKQMHHGSGTITEDDDTTMNSRYPSMVSSEYEDEGATSYPGDMTDDFTTLGGGPSLDFSVSACIDDESQHLAPATTRSPIVYSNVGQAFSRSDRMMPAKQNAPGVLSPTLDRPQRVRRSSSMSTSKHSSTLEIIDEYGVATLEPPAGSGDSMVVVSIASSGKSSARSSEARAPPREKVVVLRQLDAFQIGIIVLISVSLAAVICATFCIVGSCQVGGRRRLRGASLWTPESPPAPHTGFLTPRRQGN